MRKPSTFTRFKIDCQYVVQLYAYAALESKIRIKAISEGYDPTIGVMHEGSDGSSKFIFDLMELSVRRWIVRC